MHKFLLITVLTILSTSTSADSYRCGRSIVKVGDSANTLIKKCGDPVRKYSSKQIISDHGRQSSVGVSNWVYTRKNGKDMIVAVNSGVVIKMRVD